jgi:CubicO group peptidase (beta-lactamase class C family)
MKILLTVLLFSAAVFMIVILAYTPNTSQISNPSENNLINLNIDKSATPSNDNVQISNSFLNLFNQNKINNNNNPSIRKRTVLDDTIFKFDQYIKITFPNTAIPGAAIAVIYKDQVVYLKNIGVKNVGDSDPINSDTIFQIGSCSKALAATAVAAVVDEGKINWDDLARKYYPDTKKFTLYNPDTAEKITIRDLLSHQSGLPEQAGTELVLDFYYDFNEALYRLRYLPPEAELGTEYAYQNVLFSLAGQCSARAAGMDWGKLMENKIYAPLEMYSTVSYYEQYLKSKNRAGTHYVYNGVAYSVPPPNYNAIGPAGSICSSINDMANWVIFQVNGQFKGKHVVSTSSLKETHTAQIKMPDPDFSYGMGWVLTNIKGKNFYMHAGSTQYSSSYVLISPNDKLGIVVLANDASVGLDYGAATAWQFIRYFNQNLEKSSEHTENGLTLSPNGLTTTSLESTPLPLKNYAGYYYSNYYGYIKVIKSGNNLKLYPGKNPNPVYLSHVKGNVFKDVVYDKEVIFSDVVYNKPQKVLTKRWEIKGNNGIFIRSQKKS